MSLCADDLEMIVKVREGRLQAGAHFEPGFPVHRLRDGAAELKIMSNLRPHVNVIRLIGSCTTDLQKRQLFVLTEFCDNGSLLDYISSKFQDLEALVYNGDDPRSVSQTDKYFS